MNRIKRLPGVILILFIITSCHVMAHGANSASAPLRLVTGDGLSFKVSENGHILSLTANNSTLPLRPGPMLTLRDMSLAGNVTTPDFLLNSGFESGYTGWDVTDARGAHVSISDVVCRSGGYSLQIKAGNLGHAVISSLAVPVEPGDRYRVGGWFLSKRGYVHGVDGTPPIRQEQMWQGGIRPTGIYLVWLDAQGRPLDDESMLAAPLHWNAHEWRRVGGEVRAPHNAVSVVVNIQVSLIDDIVWVDDLFMIKSPEREIPLGGYVTTGENSLIQTASTEDGLVLRSIYRAEDDCLTIDIELLEENSAPASRALEVTWGLPLDIVSGAASGQWQWWDDVHNNRRVSSGPVALPLPEKPFNEALSWQYEHVVSGVWDGWMPISLYPWSVVENGEMGIALAVAIDEPRLVKLSYDQEQGRLQAKCYVGMEPAQKEAVHRIMRLELYMTDPAWGFRSAMDRYMKRHREWFRPGKPLWFYSDYARDSYTTPEKVKQVADNDVWGVFSAQYIVADAQVDIAPSSEPLPDYEAARAAVLNSPWNSMIINSMALSPNSDWQIKHVGKFEWSPGVWSAVWYTDVDPDIEKGWGRALWEKSVKPAIEATEAGDAVLDGVLMDNYLTAPGIDLDKKHIQAAELPLAYDIATYRPGVHNASNMYEFFTWLRGKLFERGRDDMAISVNFWGMATPNGTAPLIDAFGGEGRSRSTPEINWNPAILDYRRAIAGSKPMSFSNGDKDMKIEDVQSFINLALFYSIMPKKKDDATGWPAEAEKMLQDARDLLHTFNSSSWEPVTYASSGDPDIRMERYGSRLSRCNAMYFTVHNFGPETADAAVTVDLPKLGDISPSMVRVTELLSGEERETHSSGSQLVIPVHILTDETLVLRLDYVPETASPDAPVVEIAPDSRTFRSGDGIDFSFTVSDPQGLSDITSFRFILCGEDVTDAIIDTLVDHVVQTTDNRFRVVIPDIILPEGVWPIAVRARDMAGHEGCDRVEYTVTPEVIPLFRQ